MIDDDDVFKAAVLLPSGGRGVIGAIVSLASLAIVIALAFAACENKKECAQRKCPTAGQTPMLIKGECICFETAKKGESR